ncbi:MAG: hypothetical protein AB1566_14795, partial [Chloroflexota bacterium]
VSLFWQAEKAPSRDYTVFVHLYGPAGNWVAGADGQPVYGEYPMGQWTKGEIVEDIHVIVLDAALTPGPYRVAVGLYDLATGQRLLAELNGKLLPENAFYLQPNVDLITP